MFSSHSNLSRDKHLEYVEKRKLPHTVRVRIRRASALKQKQIAARAVMRASRVAQFGGAEVLKVETNIPVPAPSDTQVLVEVKAAGVNPIDTYIRSGTFALKPQLPYTPGYDVAGIVKAVGNKVTKFKKGDLVYVVMNVSGGYAEFTVAEEALMGRLPSTLTFQQGAGLGIPYYSAYRSLCVKARSNCKAGNTVLIHGASGAVGIACVQIGVARGLKVIGTAGTLDGKALVKKQGATAVFNHREQGYTDKILEATNGEGPDIIIEMLANVNLETDLTIVNRGGIIVIVGSRGGVEINPRHIMQKEPSVTWMVLMTASQNEWGEMHKGIAEGLTAGWLQPHIGKEYKLEEAGLAQDEVINNSGTMGKRVIVM